MASQPDFKWNTFGGSPAIIMSIMETALVTSWSNLQNAFSTLRQDASNTGYQTMYQYYSNISNITLQNTSQALANQYDITKKILDNTRS